MPDTGEDRYCVLCLIESYKASRRSKGSACIVCGRLGAAYWWDHGDSGPACGPGDCLPFGPTGRKRYQP